jgi:hypothetical protein
MTSIDQKRSLVTEAILAVHITRDLLGSPDVKGVQDLAMTTRRIVLQCTISQ